MSYKVGRSKIELRFAEGYRPAVPLDATRWAAPELVRVAMGQAWFSQRESRREVGDRELVVQARRPGPATGEGGNWEEVGRFPLGDLLGGYTAGRRHRLTRAAADALRSARALACGGQIDAGLRVADVS
jgi:hypothetical protein